MATIKLHHVAFFAAFATAAYAQQPIGSVPLQNATVSGDLTVNNGRAVLISNTTVTAKDHTAEVTLNRGGSLLVCATSGLHIAAGKSVAGAEPLLLSLNRGAIELHTTATASDMLMTPDLRFTIRSGGPLDLRLRVARNGDTCVENRGSNAPVLGISDQFGESSYEVRPGQHIMFEHGDLKEVVDNESAPCGCPPAPTVSVATAGTTSSAPAKAGSTVAEQHPFPAAISDDLAPAAPVGNSAPAGETHTQISTALSYDAAHPDTPPPSTVEPASARPATLGSPASTGIKPSSTPSPAPARTNDLIHAIGRLFHKLFHPHSNPASDRSA
ncbi:MAG TPA: nuclease [Edaphobacter sp.]|nr:nuclease [Edaphobacter sp.]